MMRHYIDYCTRNHALLDVERSQEEAKVRACGLDGVPHVQPHYKPE
jgi:hypothetical protein